MQVDDDVNNGLVKSKDNKRTCMKRLMRVEFNSFYLPQWKPGVSVYMNLLIIVTKLHLM